MSKVRRATLIVCLLLAVVVAVPEEVLAAQQLPRLETIEVTESLHAALVLLQDQWLDWLTAYHARDARRAAEVMSDIRQTMMVLRVERLPDLALGATVSAVMAARASDFVRAKWSLEAAEMLDAGRPEVAFAAATIFRLEGKHLSALASRISGYYRLFRFPWERSIVVQDALLWVLFVLVVCSALLLLLLFSTWAARLYGDLVELLSDRLPEAGAKLAGIVLLVFPVALPNGLFWLLLYWSVLLFAYVSRSEKAVLVGVWLLMGMAPGLVTVQRDYMALLMSPPVRVMEDLALSRLEGSTLRDLGSLRVALPESAAVKQLLADLHQRVGQREFARALYLDVVDAEPANAEAVLNLGAFYFDVGDYASAIQLFQRASAGETVAAAAWFNLSQSYSASYLFEESESALRTARQIDEDAVTRWVNDAERERVVVVGGGLARMDEISGDLEAAWNPSGASGSIVGRVLRSGNLVVAAVIGLLAVALDLVSRRYRIGAHSSAVVPEPVETAPRLVDLLVPGLAAVSRRRGDLAFLEILVPAALLALPLVLSFGYRVPWGYEPGRAFVWTLCVLGLIAYMVQRVTRGLRA